MQKESIVQSCKFFHVVCRIYADIVAGAEAESIEFFNENTPHENDQRVVKAFGNFLDRECRSCPDVVFREGHCPENQSAFSTGFHGNAAGAALFRGTLRTQLFEDFV